MITVSFDWEPAGYWSHVISVTGSDTYEEDAIYEQLDAQMMGWT